ncbi:MAG TPA: cytochrome c oxidase subunit II [Methylovirgula sp.]|jgi:cytochrome c oxidase subunit 2|nr:cytochrome c oxidase subunit II [Methylovirgula sp.]
MPAFVGGLRTCAGRLLASGALFLAAAAPALAAAGHADPGQMTMQTPVTPIAHEISFFYNDILTPIIIVISLFVLALLIWVMVKFNEKANPTPSQLTHHTGLELAWTIIPVLILIVIAVPSFRLLNHQLILPKADITVKVTGHQWYWTYEYPKDQGGGFSFDSYLKTGDDLKPGDIRQLSVDNEVVVPVNKVIVMQVASSDVIHSFTVPSFGIRIDAVPGRLNETWFKAEREGVYYGQCSKLCGQNHAYMPIAFRVVSQDEYATWLAGAKKKFAATSTPAVHLADNDAIPAR